MSVNLGRLIIEIVRTSGFAKRESCFSENILRVPFIWPVARLKQSCELWKHDVGLRTGKRSLDTGHDLREMLSLVEELGILRQGDVVLLNVVQRIGRLWSNNMRFMPTSKL